MNFLNKLYYQLKGLLSSKFKIVFVDELPQKYNNNTIYIVGNLDEPWLITFNCPCNCKSVIMLNLIEGANPRWRFIMSRNKLNIYPSVWRTIGCTSHFIIQNSKVVWIKAL